MGGLKDPSNMRDENTSVPKFVVYSGDLEKSVLLCVYESLIDAREQVKKLARNTPGRYFVFCTATRKEVYSVREIRKKDAGVSGTSAEPFQ
jgi:hypothetical protein